jgi:GST-like protein
MTYQLYGDKGSGAVMVEAALAEIGEPFEVVRVDLSQEGQRAPTYLAINPTGKIPALRDGQGRVLTESAAILLSLADWHPEARLLPAAGSFARAQAVRWLVYIVAEIYPMIEMRDYPARLVDGEAAGKALQSRVVERLRERWLGIESAIAGEPWLLPDGFSLADLAIGCVSRWAVGKEWRAQNCPKIERVNAALIERPRAGPVWKRHFGA